MPVGEIIQIAFAEGVATSPATPTPVSSLTGQTLADGKILVGNASNVSAAVTPTGDVTITNAGVFFVDKVSDSSDPTKQLDFDLTGATTGKKVNIVSSQTDNRTLTFPDKTGTFAITSEADIYNYIINGNFTIWQRTTSATGGINTTRAYVAPDRWCSWANTSGNSITVARDTSAPSGSLYSVKVARGSGNTNTGGIFLAQSIESFDAIKMQGKSVTLTFWAKCGANYSPTSSILVAGIYVGTGTDEIPSSTYTGETSSTSNITLTTSWQKFSVTYSSVPTTTLECKAMFRANHTGTAGADDSFYIAQVSLTEGTSAVSSVQHQHNLELLRCQRFYEKSYNLGVSPGTAAATAGAFIYLPWGTITTTATITSVPFSVRKRTTPSVSIWSRVTGSVDRMSNLSSGTDRIADSNSQGDSSFYVRHNDATSTTSGQLLAWHWTADAEI